MGPSASDHFYLRVALELAKVSRLEGGVPIGAALADSDGLISMSSNRRIQNNSLTQHAEVAALEAAGRENLRRLERSTLYSTLSPCLMCTGAILLYRIPRIVIADRLTFEGPTHLLHDAGRFVEFMQNDDAVDLMKEFTTKHPDLWAEDNGGS